MQPSTLIGQAGAAMNAGAPPMSQVSNTAPTFQPGMGAPPPTAMPQKSPASEIKETPLHRAFKRRGMQIPAQLNSPQIPAGGVGQSGGVPPQAQTGTPPAGSGGQVSPVTEAELILKAMSKHLDHKNKIEDKIVQTLLPDIAQPTNAQT